MTRGRLENVKVRKMRSRRTTDKTRQRISKLIATTRRAQRRLKETL